MHVTNKSAEEIKTTQALHSYFCVSDISAVEVLGLEGVPYYDNADGRRLKDGCGAITVAGEVDRLYAHAGAPLATCTVWIPLRAGSVQLHRDLPRAWILTTKGCDHKTPIRASTSCPALVVAVPLSGCVLTMLPRMPLRALFLIQSLRCNDATDSIA